MELMDVSFHPLTKILHVSVEMNGLCHLPAEQCLYKQLQ